MNELVGAIISTAIKIVSIKVQILDIYLEKLVNYFIINYYLL